MRSRQICHDKTHVMKETLASMAERLGISVTTISRVLNGKGNEYRINEKTQRIILAEAKKCNYVPNKLAQNLRKKKTNTIGLILPSVSNQYFADIASVIIEEANRNDYTTLVINYMENEENEKKGIYSLLSRRVDGIIISPTGNCQDILEDINKTTIPVVMIDRYFQDSNISYVTTNNYAGGRKATQVLLSNGHKKITCIQGVISSMPNTRRVKGYISAMKEAGLEANINVIGNDFSIQNGYLETKLLLSNGEKPDAIFALSNTIVLGSIKAIREAGMKIPDDISIISFDNSVYLDYLQPAITRIGQTTAEMAKLATKMLFENIKENRHNNSHLELTPDMILRDSVKNVTSEHEAD